MSSVASDANSIFPASRPLPGPRGPAQETAHKGGERFETLLDNEPAKPRSRQTETRRRDGTAAAKDHRGADAPNKAPAGNGKEPAPSGAAAVAPSQSGQAEQSTAVKPEAADRTAPADSAATDVAATIVVTEAASYDAAAEAMFAAVPAPAVVPSEVPVATAGVVAVGEIVAGPDLPALVPAEAPQPDTAPKAGSAAPAPAGIEALAAAANSGNPTQPSSQPPSPGPAQAAAAAPVGVEAPASAALPAAEKPMPPLTGEQAAPDAGQEPAPPATTSAPAVAAKPDTANDVKATDINGALKAVEPIENLGANGPVTHMGAAPAQSTAAAHVPAAAAPAQPNPAPVPVAGLAVDIAGQALAGKQRFEIRLDPPELGRIDVRLEIDRDGNVSSRLVVERSETLDMLRRDAPQLERALQQAGLKTSDNALEFSLRQESPEPRDDTPSRAAQSDADDNAVAIDTAQINYGRRMTLGGGIDIRV